MPVLNAFNTGGNTAPLGSECQGRMQGSGRINPRGVEGRTQRCRGVSQKRASRKLARQPATRLPSVSTSKRNRQPLQPTCRLKPWRRAPAHGDLQTALAKHKRKRPRLIRVIGTPVEQPSPEVCSQPAYVLTCAAGMAPTGYAAHVRHRSGECQGSRHKQAFTLRTRSMSVIAILRQQSRCYHLHQPP